MISKWLICLLAVGASLGAWAQSTDGTQTASAVLPSDTAPAEPQNEAPTVSDATETPLYRAPAPPVDQNDSRGAMMELDNEKKIEVGDQLEYMVIEDREPPTVVLVDEDGKVDVPLINKVPAVGRTQQALALAISEELKKDYYYQATVIINKHEPEDRRGIVWVMGEASKTGVVEIPPGEILRVTDAIMRAGGFTSFADPSRVVLTRPNEQNPESPQRFDVNVGQILETGDLSQDMILRANDRVFVARRGDTSGQYTVSGKGVHRPGVYPISIGQKVTISEAILLAGGLSQFGDGSDVRLIRYADDGAKTEMEINVDEILEEGKQQNDVLLKAGDRIIVGEVWARLDF